VSDAGHAPDREGIALCAHDLRGALTVIAGYAAMLQRDDLSPQDRSSALAGIEAAVVRADSILARTLSGHTVEYRPGDVVDLAELARRAAEDTRAAFGRDVTLHLLAEPAVPADKNALGRVLDNLLGNAARYAPEGAIDLTVREEQDRAVIEVADRGPGIPEEMRTAVLEPFRRLDRNADEPGTGLGLAIAAEVAARHGGAFELLGREGGGTVARLILPHD